MTDPTLGALIVDQSPDGIIFAGPDGNIQVWNDAAATIFGFSAEEAIGKSLDIIIPEQFREAHWRGFDNAINTGVTKLHGQALPTRATTAAGETLYVELSFSLIRDASGTILGAVANCRDINERFQQDRANRRRLRELEALVKESQPAKDAPAS
jgi:PAS domain S-box-containing protein